MSGNVALQPTLYQCKSGWASYTPPAGFPAPRTDAKGLLTAVLAEKRLTVTHYDSLGREVRVARGSYTDFPENCRFTRYDYEGKPVEERFVTEYGLSAPEQRITRRYYSSGHLRDVTVRQGADTARFEYTYNDAGRISETLLSGRITRTFGYNAGGWLTSSTATVVRSGLPPVIQLGETGGAQRASSLTPTYTATIFSEKLHYAESGSTARYDGKISGRTRDGRLTAYSYDSHGRLSASATGSSGSSASSGIISLKDARDFSTEYTYDRNANIKTMMRRGIVDIVGGKNVYGVQSDLTMTYTYNRLTKMEADSEGADYEGRTGVSASGTVTGFTYDSNGNLTADPSRGILQIKYNRLNQPTDVYLTGGQRQHITYDGLGGKLSVEYSQVPEAMLTTPETVYADNEYQLQSRRSYVGPHGFRDGKLEYSAFAGGYFDPQGGTMYYLTDWQGNNAVVADNRGNVVQETTYYPYGEPTIEPGGQRYLFGGKEREHAGGRNAYDFGARILTPYGSWSTPDPLAWKFYPISPYSYCGGDPINNIDPNGCQELPVPSKHNNISPTNSNDFGEIRKVSKKPHGGVDINFVGIEDKGLPVYSTHRGKISKIVPVEDSDGGGKRIYVTSPGGRVMTRYMHLDKVADGLEEGTWVKEGQEIGKIGNTGHSTGSHLHYEIWADGKRIDPAINENHLIDAQILQNVIEDDRRIDLEEIIVIGIDPHPESRNNNEYIKIPNTIEPPQGNLTPF